MAEESVENTKANQPTNQPNKTLKLNISFPRILGLGFTNNLNS